MSAIIRKWSGLLSASTSASLSVLLLVGAIGVVGISSAVAQQAEQAAPLQPLQVGDKAPDFSLPASDGQTYTLSQFAGVRPVVIAFFPKAFTGG